MSDGHCKKMVPVMSDGHYQYITFAVWLDLCTCGVSETDDADPEGIATSVRFLLH